MGFEPTTSAVTGRHSNQLNYQAINNLMKLFILISSSRTGYSCFARPFHGEYSFSRTG